LKYFIVSFDRPLVPSLYAAFHNDFVANTRIRRWSHFIKSHYLIGTNMTARELSTHFRETALKHSVPTRHLVAAVDLRNVSGWMPKRAWEWIAKQTPQQDGEK